ncbi:MULTISPECIES: hypothetical protein [Vibrio]|uniref:Uncharacterized protein n=2 Tax=Vibrio TaxID=662 RepID=A0AAU9QR30_9VIBR|nr:MULTISPECIES: hypothetical protein [Vibrio]CAH1590049.1 conserved hypothetical protein [Vibrio jasicida]CAH1599355.1 conserved hypothetical protein [Vibrio jasicida]
MSQNSDKLYRENSYRGNVAESEPELKAKLKDWQILPPMNPLACKECATVHAPEAPHNMESLNYKYNFAKANGRWPTWADACSHCSEEIKQLVKGLLSDKGIDYA